MFAPIDCSPSPCNSPHSADPLQTGSLSTPSVFHVASSTTHGEPVANQFRRIFLPYWTQRPPPVTLYARPYRNMWKKSFYSREKSLTFRVCCLLPGLSFHPCQKPLKVQEL